MRFTEKIQLKSEKHRVDEVTNSHTLPHTSQTNPSFHNFPPIMAPLTFHGILPGVLIISKHSF